MTITPDGIIAAAERELEAHPVTPKGKPITAWERRAQTIVKTIDLVNTHEDRVNKLEEALGELRSRPF